ncbi:MAG: O-antigen ligase family protein, partial [Pseudomonadota bacterium]
MSSKKFIIKESTRKRCRVFPIDSFDRRKFTPISMELFHFLYEAPTIDFSIFIRVDEEMVEYIKATELSKELLKHIWLASIKDDAEVEICVQSADHAKFTRVIDSVRDLKIRRLIEREPALDSKTLISFVNLSGASQMILRGGINEDATRKVAAAASFMVSNLMDNNYSIATLSRMIQIDPSLYDHSAAVAMFSGIMGKQAYQGKLSQKNAESLAQCGLYHDAGKACIPHAVLNKPGAFTPEEFEIMKSHAIQGLVVTAGGFAIVGFYAVRSRFKQQFIAYGYAAAVMILGVVAVLGTLQKGPLSFVYKRSVSLRGSYWNTGIEMGKTHPFTGVGLDTYGDWYRRSRPPVALIDTPGINTLSNVAHNVVIDFFASGGYPLLLSYLGILGFAFVSIIRVTARRKEYDRVFVGLTAVWLCYEVQSFISINQIGLAIWGWLFTGLLVAYERSTRVEIQEIDSTKS